MTVVCPLHGDLLPCKEHVVGQSKKDPTKCPVPSYARIATSGIPDAGHGVFATAFIEPGRIIGKMGDARDSTELSDLSFLRAKSYRLFLQASTRVRY